MCGIAGIFGQRWQPADLEAMVESQRHRGPNGRGTFLDPSGAAGLGHNRLSIIDLSPAGAQPMSSSDGRFSIAFNGEIYNYVELRKQLSGYPFRTGTDTEVLLAAYARWGAGCLDRLIGMFAFLIWDREEQRLFAARDRFGVKPLQYCRRPDGGLLVASEIKALGAGGHPLEPDAATWATYLARGLSDHSSRTFWAGVSSLPAGHYLTWEAGELQTTCWYDLPQRIGDEFDSRPLEVVEEEYFSLLTDSVRLRFRSDVPVGISLSGGLDSSLLLGLVHAVQGAASAIKAFTFVTGDPAYDELPWVQQMLARTEHPSIACRIEATEVPRLAESIRSHQDEPFGGLPTLAYARLFERARAEGVIVLLDGQGMDEQWAGYDYYLSAVEPASLEKPDEERYVQGTRERSVRPECLTPELRSLASPFEPSAPFSDALRNLQYRDLRFTKIPKALRFNDRISMRAGTELREPFLDHRLVELAFRQPAERKLASGQRKWLLRRIGRRLLPDGLIEAPKRPVQTPQREWLRGPLRTWAAECIEVALAEYGGSWLDQKSVRTFWSQYCAGQGDNSFYVWQWIDLGLACLHAQLRSTRLSSV